MNGTKVTGACLRDLAAIKSLRVIHLRDTLVSGEGLAELEKLPMLEVVEAIDTPISDADIPYLRQIHNAVVRVAGSKLSLEAQQQLPAAWRCTP